jgi:hypothetical protein
MSEATTCVTAPTLPDPATIADPRFTISDSSARHLLTYCPSNSTGGIYTLATGRWQIQCGLPFHEFAAFAALCGLIVDDSPAVRLWIESCQARDRQAANTSSPPTNHH